MLPELAASQVLWLRGHAAASLLLHHCQHRLLLLLEE
jgi:hypothetical protein